jgi:hypothetical protein
VRLPTLFETALIAALALLAHGLIQPSVQAGMRANAESTALEALRRITRAERSLRPAGSYVLLPALAASRGAQLFPGGGERVLDEGTVEWRGYCFRTYLAAADGRGTTVAKDADGNRARACLAVYAWPMPGASNGMRVFLATGGADFSLYATENVRGAYLGPERAPLPGAAFKDGRTGHICGSVPGPPELGADGLEWRPLAAER